MLRRTFLGSSALMLVGCGSNPLAKDQLEAMKRGKVTAAFFDADRMFTYVNVQHLIIAAAFDSRRVTYLGELDLEPDLSKSMAATYSGAGLPARSIHEVLDPQRIRALREEQSQMFNGTDTKNGKDPVVINDTLPQGMVDALRGAGQDYLLWATWNRFWNYTAFRAPLFLSGIIGERKFMLYMKLAAFDVRANKLVGQWFLSHRIDAEIPATTPINQHIEANSFANLRGLILRESPKIYLGAAKDLGLNVPV